MNIYSEADHCSFYQQYIWVWVPEVEEGKICRQASSKHCFSLAVVRSIYWKQDQNVRKVMKTKNPHWEISFRWVALACGYFWLTPWSIDRPSSVFLCISPYFSVFPPTFLYLSLLFSISSYSNVCLCSTIESCNEPSTFCFLYINIIRYSHGTGIAVVSSWDNRM